MHTTGTHRTSRTRQAGPPASTTSPPDRVDGLVARMTVPEKAGALLAARVTMNPDGTLWEGADSQSPFGFTPTTELLLERHVGHLGLMSIPSVPALARWGEEIRATTARSRLGIPVTVGADPTHGRVRNAHVGQSGAGFSMLTEPIGLAATWDAALVEETARMMARELRAAGVHIAVHPMADLATEPRWARVAGTFGEDPEHTSTMIRAFVRGLQSGGAHERVLATAKHFPGGGPQQNGEDAHFERGAHTVYPGNRFDDHLRPFAAAIDEGVAMIMPGYAAPLGPAPDLDLEEVGFAFQRGLITDLLRHRLGFDGVVVTDFNIVTGMRLPRLGLELPVRAWGLLELPPVERVARLFDAGVDQFGGEDDPALILEALDRGLVTEERLDTSVRRVLRDKERLGLLDDPSAGAVSPAAVHLQVATRESLTLARRVQAASVVALTGHPTRLGRDVRVYAEGVDPHVLAAYAVPVDNVEEADLAVLRLAAPYDAHPAGSLEAAFHSGSLEFPAETVRHVQAVAAAVPTVVDVFLERAAVLTPFGALPGVTLIGTFGVDDEVLLDAVGGRTAVAGRLPFDLPRSDAAVAAAREDTPFDTLDPVFRFGHGLRWPARNRATT
ncbi:glycoside hydrolase family 3 protein [Streptomyces sp. NBC_00237]|uniref:glycoside hydrolase family 3 protein n=1 Tax=Streptomyces sp. NBC_00237 TaxID=2975687 RepID=UPI002254C9AB|nr:glycoside hydrolase family 3 N-terminal domain-containing protein [Streptomyces sp. NBC_00237]MCX5205855.1 glycoside hydrolase family 3 protein [Streptomyces sp. NBC_00237]